jgi:hypothetical protein
MFGSVLSRDVKWLKFLATFSQLNVRILTSILDGRRDFCLPLNEFECKKITVLYKKQKKNDNLKKQILHETKFSIKGDEQ